MNLASVGLDESNHDREFVGRVERILYEIVEFTVAFFPSLRIVVLLFLCFFAEVTASALP